MFSKYNRNVFEDNTTCGALPLFLTSFGSEDEKPVNVKHFPKAAGLSLTKLVPSDRDTLSSNNDLQDEVAAEEIA